MNVNIRNKRAILLTGTIISNSIHTYYADENVRFKEYLFAIDFYSKQFKDDDIFFLENSDFDLGANPDYLKLSSAISFTLIKFKRSDKFNEGKGYQEFEMVDKAIDQLKDNYESFIKITGRYIVSNGFDITDFKCDGLVIDLNRKRKNAQTYFFYVSTEFYLKHIKNEYKNVNDQQGIFIEHVIYKKIEALQLFDQCKLFKKTPLLSGTTGSYGIVMKRNYFRVKFRNVERFFYNLLNIPAFFY